MEQGIFQVIGISLVAAVLVLVLRKKCAEQAFAVTIACVAVVGIYLLGEAAQLLDRIRSLGAVASPENFECVVKSVGICILTQTASDTCTDFGQSALAGKIELAGKLAILVVSLPLFDALIAVIQQLLG